jgi:hypothetical protein
MTHNVGNDPVRYGLAVLSSSAKLSVRFSITHLVPVLAILLPTGLIVADLAVEEQHGKVDDVKVGKRGAEASREAPSPAISGQFHQDRTSLERTP